ncbi:hypothetical protein VdG1_05894 [Verticillium dahliae VDG1]|nr:hypothetical protein VdG1_05894 [Verticillium dahliae VDG1]
MQKSGEKPRKAIVVGAGAGGVAIAARLAKAGYKVTVLEKNDFTGGRCSLIHHEGYRFDQGPSLLLLPQLFHETFRDLDTTIADSGVDLLRCQDVNYNVWFHDGELFKHSSDLATMKVEVERWEGKEGFARYLSWMREAHTHYEVSVTDVLHRNFTSLFNLAWPSLLKHVVALHPLESIYARASRYFWTERLRRVFTFAVMYMGMSPFDAPATYSLLQYTEFAEGIWYPRGGFHAIIAALVRIGEQMGVEYRLNTSVASISTAEESNRATGVVLESGESLSADVVVINADLVYAYSNLMPKTPSTVAYSQSLQKKEASCSSISFYWSVNRKIPELGTHNIFLAEEYRESFDAIFKRHGLPDQPSFYVNVPSRIDPSAAPEDGDAIIVLVPIGHLARSKGSVDAPGLPTDEKSWINLVARARAAVLETISARTGCAPIGQFITNEIVNNPLSWEDKFNLDKGAILGLTHSNAYFVGASTHPGTGVPIVLAGAKITAEQILDDRGLPVPWAHTKNFPKQQLAERRQKTKALDLMRYTFHFGSEEVAVLSFFSTSTPPMLNSTVKSTMSQTLRHARIAPHRSGTRGHSDHGWLNTYHSFSFADWYNPEYTHFGALRVLNEDRLTHRDSMLRKGAEGEAGADRFYRMRRGDVQFTTGGTGIAHSEMNEHARDAVHFLQIWAIPWRRGLPPAYHTRHFDDDAKRAAFVPVLSPLRAGPDASAADEKAAEPAVEGTIPIHADLVMGAGIIAPGRVFEWTIGGRGTTQTNRKVFVHLPMTKSGKAKIRIDGRDDAVLSEGDGAFVDAVHAGDKLGVESVGEAEAEVIVLDTA